MNHPHNRGTKFSGLIRIPPEFRSFLLRRFPPVFADVYAFHAMVFYRAGRYYEPPTEEQRVRIWGWHLSDFAECLLIDVNDTNQRPDGERFHITLSVKPGYPPASSKIIDEARIERLDEPLFFSGYAEKVYRQPVIPERQMNILIA